MEIKHQVIKKFNVWASLPNMATLPVITKPIKTSPNETYKEEYTESQLRSLALENRADKLTGLTVSAAALQNLPADFFTAHYLHVRYRRPLPSNYYPLRIDSSTDIKLTTTAHGLSGMICMALVLRAILERVATTIDAQKKREARDISLLLRQVQYAIYETLVKYPLGVGENNLIIGSYTEILRYQNQTEASYWVMFDEDRLAEYTGAGHTVQDAIDHWTVNKTQPVW